jgi:NADH:ubiquinone oxidoreductase subunit 3 (subunit A)
VLLGLSTTNKIGLAGTAIVFIAFALASSFLFPRRWPDYPGRRLGLFILVTAALTVAMLAAVEVFAVEDEEEHEGGGEQEALVVRAL